MSVRVCVTERLSRERYIDIYIYVERDRKRGGKRTS